MDASTSISTGRSSVSETPPSLANVARVVSSLVMSPSSLETGTDLEVTSVSSASSESESSRRGAELVDMSARPAADAAAAADATASARARVCSAAAASARARARALKRREGREGDGDAIPEPSREAEPSSFVAAAPESASAFRLGVASPARTPRTMGVTASAATFVGAGVGTSEVTFKPSTTPATILPTASSRCRRRARVSRSTEPRPTHAPTRNARMSTRNATGRDRPPRSDTSVPASIPLASKERGGGVPSRARTTAPRVAAERAS
jgi:hypothetical protein